MKKLITISLLSLFATGAFAEGKKKGDEAQTAKLSAFNLVDSDGDGYISPAEAKNLTGLDAAFKKIDANGDQRISKEEFSKFEYRTR